MALKINIETIPHNQQRYDTVGDWWWGPDASWQIRVSAMKDWRHEVLVALHELAECAMCRYLGISQASVDEWDQTFEAARPDGNTDEPGDDPRAPYYLPHAIASGIERVVAGVLGVDWKRYDDEANAL